jgi:hypothetical protein
MHFAMTVKFLVINFNRTRHLVIRRSVAGSERRPWLGLDRRTQLARVRWPFTARRCGFCGRHERRCRKGRLAATGIVPEAAI